MRVLFVADDRQESGLGHVVRSGALRDEMIERGHETYWCAWWEMPNPAIQYDAVVYDGYWDDERDILGVIEAWNEAQPQALKVYISDDPRQYQPFDLIVNGGAGARAQPYIDRERNHRGNRTRVLAGPDYALLRKEFQWAHHQIVRLMPTERYRAQIAFDTRVTRGLPVDLMVNYMRHASLVITDGGMRSLEAACLGAPQMVVPKSYGENENAKGLANSGAAVRYLGLGDTEYVSKYFFGKRLDIVGMADRALRLVDGYGCDRVATEIEDLAGYLKPEKGMGSWIVE